MTVSRLSLLFVMLVAVLFGTVEAHAQYQLNEQEAKVAMRMIGHRLLLKDGDKTSRVLPIENDENRYTISFENELGIQPGPLAVIVDSVMRETDLAWHYIVEVVSCDSSKVMYSFELGPPDGPDMIPCGSRDLPSDCYAINITLFDDPSAFAKAKPYEPEKLMSRGAPGNSNQQIIMVVSTFLLLLLIGSIGVVLKRKRKQEVDLTVDPNLIAIGGYRFDPRNMQLSFEETTIELTGKEADLLSVLHTQANTTITREEILKQVWGDEGDYVGRTLDVFISKLRKKLEGDSSIKIINVRGVGYKLVVND